MGDFGVNLTAFRGSSTRLPMCLPRMSIPSAPNFFLITLPGRSVCPKESSEKLSIATINNAFLFMTLDLIICTRTHSIVVPKVFHKSVRCATKNVSGDEL